MNEFDGEKVTKSKIVRDKDPYIFFRQRYFDVLQLNWHKHLHSYRKGQPRPSKSQAAWLSI